MKEDWDQCLTCDHTYLPNQACVGISVACKDCCANSDGELVYVPQYVIQELVLT